MCIPFDVMRERISIHQPLWRLMAGLFTAPAEFLHNAISRCVEDGICDENVEGRRAMLYEMPMRFVFHFDGTLTFYAFSIRAPP